MCLHGACSPEQVIRVFSGQVQIFCSCAVMAELHGGQEQFRDRCYLNQQQEREAKPNWKGTENGYIKSTEGRGWAALKQDDFGTLARGH